MVNEAVQINESSRIACEWTAAAKVIRATESEMWRYKRECQARDVANANSGALTSEQMNWFAGGVARRAKLVNSPF